MFETIRDTQAAATERGVQNLPGAMLRLFAPMLCMLARFGPLQSCMSIKRLCARFNPGTQRLLGVCLESSDQQLQKLSSAKRVRFLSKSTG